MLPILMGKIRKRRMMSDDAPSPDYIRGWRDCAKTTRDHLKAVTKQAKGGMNMMMVGTIAIIQDEINGVGGKYDPKPEPTADA